MQAVRATASIIRDSEAFSPMVFVERVFVDRESRWVVTEAGLIRQSCNRSIGGTARLVHANQFGVVAVLIVSANVMEYENGIHV
jgi:hypothetical protein